MESAPGSSQGKGDVRRKQQLLDEQYQQQQLDQLQRQQEQQLERLLQLQELRQAQELQQQQQQQTERLQQQLRMQQRQQQDEDYQPVPATKTTVQPNLAMLLQPSTTAPAIPIFVEGPHDDDHDDHKPHVDIPEKPQTAEASTKHVCYFPFFQVVYLDSAKHGTATRTRSSFRL
jgi:TolA-binding protein